ncbi:MAG: GAF domain-containing protein [Candidatus Heimdallarchaeaceae archaeon]
MFKNLDNIQQGVALFDRKKHIFSYVNKKMCELLGYEENELLSSDFDSTKLFSEIYMTNPLFKDKISYTAFEMKTKEGKSTTQILSSSPIPKLKLNFVLIQDIIDFQSAQKRGLLELSNYVKTKVGLVRYSFEKVGFAIKETLDIDFIDDSERKLTQIAIYYMSTIKNQIGLFGPLPVTEEEDLRAIVYSYKIDMKKFGIKEFDSRMQGEQISLIVLLFPKTLENLIIDRITLRHIFKNIVHNPENYGSTSDGSSKLLSIIKNKLFGELRSISPQKSFEEKLLILQEIKSEQFSRDNIKLDFQKISQIASTILDFKKFSVLSIDRFKGVLKVISQSGYEEEVEKEIRTLEIPVNSKSIVTRAFKERRTQNVGDVKEDPEYLGMDPAVNSEMATPIFSPFKREVLGVINIESEMKNNFSEEDEILLELLAEKSSIILEKYDLENKLFYLSELVKELLKVKEKAKKEIYQVIGKFFEKAFNFSFFSVLLINKQKKLIEAVYWQGYSELSDDAKLIPINSKKSVVAKVAREKKLINISDVKNIEFYVSIHEDIMSELAVPIYKNNEVIGIINLESKEHGAFSNIDEHIVSIISDILGCMQ